MISLGCAKNLVDAEIMLGSVLERGMQITSHPDEADVLVVITEWHEFRGLDPRRIKQVMRQPRIVDLRNIFNPEEMRGLGFVYEGVGRPKPRT